MVNCKVCGYNEINDNAKFCSKCGVVLHETNINNQQYQQSNYAEKLKTIGSIIGILIIGFTIYFAYITIDYLKDIGSYEDIVQNYNNLLNKPVKTDTSEEYYKYKLDLMDLEIRIGRYSETYNESLKRESDKALKLGEMMYTVKQVQSILKDTDDTIKSYIEKYKHVSSKYELEECIQVGENIYNDKKNIIDTIKYFKTIFAKQYTECAAQYSQL